MELKKSHTGLSMPNLLDLSLTIVGEVHRLEREMISPRKFLSDKKLLKELRANCELLSELCGKLKDVVSNDFLHVRETPEGGLIENRLCVHVPRPTLLSAIDKLVKQYQSEDTSENPLDDNFAQQICCKDIKDLKYDAHSPKHQLELHKARTQLKELSTHLMRDIDTVNKFMPTIVNEIVQLGASDEVPHSAICETFNKTKSLAIGVDCMIKIMNNHRTLTKLLDSVYIN